MGPKEKNLTLMSLEFWKEKRKEEELEKYLKAVKTSQIWQDT